ncbi:hypothetical protein ATANTOWER_000728 [Ataeniobius toweri]|uniref:Uncharacterized protein n=1 Tax=Ataeniobius toweri TaxID=208326 RepID=A0ABU7ANJ8_9TELE|nr:hypothetical protein [Ataeniobius toweri]
MSVNRARTACCGNRGIMNQEENNRAFAGRWDLSVFSIITTEDSTEIFPRWKTLVSQCYTSSRTNQGDEDQVRFQFCIKSVRHRRPGAEDGIKKETRKTEKSDSFCWFMKMQENEK